MNRRFLSLASAAAALSLAAAAGMSSEPSPKVVPFTAVRITDGFWAPRIETNRKITVWYDFAKCEETGRIANFARAGGLEKGKFQGIAFNDSDVFKVVEGAAYLLALQPEAKLDKYLDNLIVKIAAAQEDDGYLYTARTLGFTNRMTGPKRWSHTAHNHELYNVGHMYEAAVAHFQATGKRSLLDVAIKNADLVCKVFGPGEGQIVDVPGHEEIEIGLVKLYQATDDKKYLDQAKFFIDMRGRTDKRKKVYGKYAQDHKPVVEQSEAVGHAVRGGYLYAGVADVAALTGEQAYIDAIDRIWTDVVSRKLYLIGSVGQHGAGEGYAGAYTLPNVRAYNETCAAIALALWNHRMFLLHGEAKYIDVLERIVYNGFLAGISLSGDRFFYPNSLACDMRFKFNHGSLERSPWFGCSCCPVNVVRFIPSIAGYVYAARGDAAYVNLFIGSTAALPTAGGVTLAQETNYPWDGAVKITVTPKRRGEFDLLVRIPGWARGQVLPSDLYTFADKSDAKVAMSVNGRAAPTDKLEGGYVRIRRTWKAGDVVELDLPMPVRLIHAHKNVEADIGRVAVQRGPIVYCVEGADHGGKVLNMFLPDDAKLSAEHRGDLLGGTTVLRGGARTAHRGDDGKIASKPATLTMIPYYAWCHRGPNEMTVWLPRSAELAKVSPPPTLASTSRATASHCNNTDAVSALNDHILPKKSNDLGITRMTWWPHKGTTEWVQYDFRKPAKVGSVEVYWFDDTGRGQCRVPASWKLLHKDGKTWKPIQAKGKFGTAKDKFNKVAFEPVSTKALRLEVKLQANFSGGILEWRVGAEK